MSNYLLDMYFEFVCSDDPLTYDDRVRCVVYVNGVDEAHKMADKIMRSLLEGDASLQYHSVVVTKL